MLTSALLRPVISKAGRPPRENATQVALGTPGRPVRDTPQVPPPHAPPEAPVPAIFPASLPNPGRIFLCRVPHSLGGFLVLRAGFRWICPPPPALLSKPERSQTGNGPEPEQNLVTKVRCYREGRVSVQEPGGPVALSPWNSCFDFFLTACVLGAREGADRGAETDLIIPLEAGSPA